MYFTYADDSSEFRVTKSMYDSFRKIEPELEDFRKYTFIHENAVTALCMHDLSLIEKYNLHSEMFDEIECKFIFFGMIEDLKRGKKEYNKVHWGFVSAEWPLWDFSDKSDSYGKERRLKYLSHFSRNNLKLNFEYVTDVYVDSKNSPEYVKACKLWYNNRIMEDRWGVYYYENIGWRYYDKWHDSMRTCPEEIEGVVNGRFYTLLNDINHYVRYPFLLPGRPVPYGNKYWPPYDEKSQVKSPYNIDPYDPDRVDKIITDWKKMVIIKRNYFMDNDVSYYCVPEHWAKIAYMFGAKMKGKGRDFCYKEIIEEAYQHFEEATFEDVQKSFRYYPKEDNESDIDMFITPEFYQSVSKIIEEDPQTGYMRFIFDDPKYKDPDDPVVKILD